MKQFNKNNECQNCECEECLQMLELFLDNEATEQQKNQVKLHIETCEHCKYCYEVDSQLKNRLKEQISNKKCPSEIIKCIQSKIKEMVLS
ncbi:MAG: hypothetical protein EAZ85_04085 [Bacteroidetes bacterium]|nr:MAG: hypothetical protein EAZ85_04085 [Bacteroidota bacterium]TAG90037.1 MAG: hypothetical protein EAZ20_05245 [Bacteroidota bacterium]